MDAKRKATDPRDEADVEKEIRSFFVFFIGVSGPSTKGPGLHVGAKAGTVFACETFCRCMIWTELMKTCYKCS